MSYIEYGWLIVALGILGILKPDISIRYKIWEQRVFFGAEYKPSSRTHKTIRFIGVFITIMGIIFIIFGKLTGKMYF